MKIIRNTPNKDGSVTVTVRIQPGGRAVISLHDKHIAARCVELLTKHPFMTINPNHHYRLGGQVDDIVAPHVIADAVPVYWCSIEQKWVEA